MLKKPFTLDEQIERLNAHGLIIEDKKQLINEVLSATTKFNQQIDLECLGFVNNWEKMLKDRV